MLKSNKIYVMLCYVMLFLKINLPFSDQQNFPIKFDSVMSGWSIVYIGGSQVII